MAADAAFVGLSAAVATHIRSAATSRNDVIKLERTIETERQGAPSMVHTPAAAPRRLMSETEIEVLREYAKDATKRQGKSAAGAGPGKRAQPASPSPGASSSSLTDGLGFQSRYLVALRERTNGMVADVEQRFKQHAPALRRLSVDDLEAVAAALTQDAAMEIGRAYARAAIVEWTNLVARATHDEDDTGKLALNRGMYGPERQPMGVIRVDVVAEGSDLQIRRTSLDMPNDATVDALKNMGGTLGSLPVHRMVAVSRMYSEHRWMVTPDHHIESIDGSSRAGGVARNDPSKGFAGVVHDAEAQQLKDLLDSYPAANLVSA